MNDLIAYVVVNEKGEYWSNRSGLFMPTLKMSHLFHTQNKASKCANDLASFGKNASVKELTFCVKG